MQKPNVLTMTPSTPPVSATAKGAAPPVITDPARVEVLAPFFIGLDWLTINMRSPRTHAFDVLETTGFVSSLDRARQMWIRPRTQGTPEFERTADVHDHDRTKLFTVQFSPRNKTRDPQYCKVQFANETLYTGEWVDLFHMLRAQGFELDSISRMDIAADGHATDGGGYLDVMDRRLSGEVKYYGKGDWSPYMRRNGVQGFRVGNSASDKYIRCYNKSKELKSSKKTYIYNRWATSLGGEDPHAGGDVHRFEAQLKGKGIRRYVGTDERDPLYLASLATPEPLVSLFASMATGLFDFRTPAVRARDARSVVAWDFSRVEVPDPTINVRAPRKHILTVEEVKRGCRYIFLGALGMSHPQAEDMARAWAASVDESEWYERKRRQWFRDYGKMIAGGDMKTADIFRKLANGADNSPDTVGGLFLLD